MYSLEMQADASMLTLQAQSDKSDKLLVCTILQTVLSVCPSSWKILCVIDNILFWVEGFQCCSVNSEPLRLFMLLKLNLKHSTQSFFSVNISHSMEGCAVLLIRSCNDSGSANLVFTQ